MEAATKSDLRSTATTPTPHSAPLTLDIEKAESQLSDCNLSPTVPRVFPYTNIKNMKGNMAKIGTQPSHNPNLTSMDLVPVPTKNDDGTTTLKCHLPGQPRVRLDEKNPGSHWLPLSEYLDDNHLTTKLDGMFKWMKYVFVQTPSFLHIMSLHHQYAHDREVKIDEHPCLHLVWYYERIYVKPVPAYFYCAAFWEYIANAHLDVYRACLGFMRSYYYLIQYEVDFALACEKKLIPKKSNGQFPTYEEWCDFIEPFTKVHDIQVPKRYHYGELRLSRLNMAAAFFKRKLAFFHIYPQWGSFLTHSLGPLLTIFAICSVVLNSMQVSLQALDSELPEDHSWPKWKAASIWFPIVVTILIAMVIVLALGGVCVMAVVDLYSGIRTRRKKRDINEKTGKKTHGVIW
ncbi:hypothetical protein SMACR_01512 [Sordaria macrospora]|uniref:WGS project CABT00000000 data, contig 2.4 n=2 Tax=Sordaria macrospora TaxID=5147 RepID=F7VR16_SORMK|nr:uncharacterized protein SMAC_01512 [Sordaria macrospora k-hell]KAA8629115.1 hypothetical protein SMACR_01512 [Sordaria macrospora]KAH7634616.1 hypothetical protein B0T09DRAFT_353256 [Sordaria sp. MPI-SDFR-AT-0083]WPJ58601.1 hypothetical protein SMAC4_01512 [Sordaria macrospora]CCC07949.1 unnamed protein product [Sordaria macrospora k-hell]